MRPSPIVTRGFARKRFNEGFPDVPGNRIVTQGYGGIRRVIKEAVRRGGSKGLDALKKLRRLPEIIYEVCARLIRVNDRDVTEEIIGTAKRTVNPNIDDPSITADVKDSSITKPNSDILITASRIVRSEKKGGDKGE